MRNVLLNNLWYIATRRPFNCEQKNELMARWKVLSTKYVLYINTYSIYVYDEELALNNLQMVNVLKNKPNQIKYLLLNCLYYITILETIQLCGKT